MPEVRTRFLIRGLERIRTAVGAFAELSLATRPRDLFLFLGSTYAKRSGRQARDLFLFLGSTYAKRSGRQARDQFRT